MNSNESSIHILPLQCIKGNFAERPLSRLCKHCQNIFDYWYEVSIAKRDQFQHCEDLSVLQSSAKDGCDLCAQFLLGRGSVGNWNDDILGDDSSAPARGIIFLKLGRDIGLLFEGENYWRLELTLPYGAGILNSNNSFRDSITDRKPVAVTLMVDMVLALQPGKL